ncbi:efflux RND transporter permease subunit, partial [Escherichia coli]|uniref:efflux RND transporter permease subunit n=1 Tax=Escherichia coli TaxID=562 RepID=UPI0022826AE3
MTEVVGRLFREFAITLAVSILISLVVSLTLTPMMCARLLKAEPKEPKPPGRLASWAEGGFAWMQDGYRRSLAWALAHSRLMMLILAAAVMLFMGFVPWATSSIAVMFVLLFLCGWFQGM